MIFKKKDHELINNIPKQLTNKQPIPLKNPFQNISTAQKSNSSMKNNKDGNQANIIPQIQEPKILMTGNDFITSNSNSIKNDDIGKTNSIQTKANQSQIHESSIKQLKLSSKYFGLSNDNINNILKNNETKETKIRTDVKTNNTNMDQSDKLDLQKLDDIFNEYGSNISSKLSSSVKKCGIQCLMELEGCEKEFPSKKNMYTHLVTECEFFICRLCAKRMKGSTNMNSAFNVNSNSMRNANLSNIANNNNYYFLYKIKNEISLCVIAEENKGICKESIKLSKFSYNFNSEELKEIRENSIYFTPTEKPQINPDVYYRNISSGYNSSKKNAYSKDNFISFNKFYYKSVNNNDSNVKKESKFNNSNYIIDETTKDNDVVKFSETQEMNVINSNKTNDNAGSKNNKSVNNFIEEKGDIVDYKRIKNNYNNENKPRNNITSFSPPKSKRNNSSDFSNLKEIINDDIANVSLTNRKIKFSSNRVSEDFNNLNNNQASLNIQSLKNPKVKTNSGNNNELMHLNIPKINSILESLNNNIRSNNNKHNDIKSNIKVNNVNIREKISTSSLNNYIKETNNSQLTHFKLSNSKSLCNNLKNSNILNTNSNRDINKNSIHPCIFSNKVLIPSNESSFTVYQIKNISFIKTINHNKFHKQNLIKKIINFEDFLLESQLINYDINDNNEVFNKCSFNNLDMIPNEKNFKEKKKFTKEILDNSILFGKSAINKYLKDAENKKDNAYHLLHSINQKKIVNKNEDFLLESGNVTPNTNNEKSYVSHSPLDISKHHSRLSYFSKKSNKTSKTKKSGKTNKTSKTCNLTNSSNRDTPDIMLKQDKSFTRINDNKRLNMKSNIKNNSSRTKNSSATNDLYYNKVCFKSNENKTNRFKQNISNIIDENSSVNSNASSSSLNHSHNITKITVTKPLKSKNNTMTTKNSKNKEPKQRSSYPSPSRNSFNLDTSQINCFNNKTRNSNLEVNESENASKSIINEDNDKSNLNLSNSNIDNTPNTPLGFFNKFKMFSNTYKEASRKETKHNKSKSLFTSIFTNPNQLKYNNDNSNSDYSKEDEDYYSNRLTKINKYTTINKVNNAALSALVFVNDYKNIPICGKPSSLVKLSNSKKPKIKKISNNFNALLHNKVDSNSTNTKFKLFGVNSLYFNKKQQFSCSNSILSLALIEEFNLILAGLESGKISLFYSNKDFKHKKYLNIKPIITFPREHDEVSIMRVLNSKSFLYYCDDKVVNFFYIILASTTTRGKVYIYRLEISRQRKSKEEEHIFDNHDNNHIKKKKNQKSKSACINKHITKETKKNNIFTDNEDLSNSKESEDLIESEDLGYNLVRVKTIEIDSLVLTSLEVFLKQQDNQLKINSNIQEIKEKSNILEIKGTYLPSNNIADMKHKEYKINEFLNKFKIILGTTTGDLVTIDIQNNIYYKQKIQKDSISCLLYSNSFKYFFSASIDKTIVIWDYKDNKIDISNKQLDAFNKLNISISKMEIINEYCIIMLNSDNKVRIWCLNSLSLLLTYCMSNEAKNKILSFCYNETREELIFGFEDKTLTYTKIDKDKLDHSKEHFLFILNYYLSYYIL